MKPTTEEKNIAIAREAFDKVFNQRDFSAFDKYWSPNYIQHSAHIPPGRDGLRNLVKSFETVRYEQNMIMADGDYVMCHGRFVGLPGPNWIVVDIIRFEDGILAEHWDIIQDEATKESSVSGNPMFGNEFGTIPLPK
ncbi:MAG TPA: nuclear transport factor 2 family protein [Puia sp.]